MPSPTSTTGKNRFTRLLRKSWIWLSLVVASFLLIPWLVGPPCPDQIVIAAGRLDGSYYAFAKQYQELLKPHGIDLVIQETSGSIDNLNRITADDSQVDLAFVQGGVRPANGADNIRSLASLYFEPVWVFCQSGIDAHDLHALAGKRIAVDRPGSGTRQLADSLLRANGITGDDGSELVELGGRDAADAFAAGKIDAAFFVMSPESELIKSLLHNEDVELLNWRRAKAYAAHDRYLSTVTLPEGYFDLRTNIPDSDVRLLAPAANLVATDSLHPALIPLMLEVAGRVHEAGGCFARFGEFPNPHFVDFPILEDARRYFQTGPSPLYRWLPFHWAAWLDRMKLLLLPLCTLLFPLVKVAPPVYRRQIRCKIYRWYKVLRQIDLELDEAGQSVDVNPNLQRLDALEKELAEISVPLSYMEEFYNLHLHVDHVRKRLHAQSAAVSAADAEYPREAA